MAESQPIGHVVTRQQNVSDTNSLFLHKQKHFEQFRFGICSAFKIGPVGVWVFTVLGIIDPSYSGLGAPGRKSLIWVGDISKTHVANPQVVTVCIALEQTMRIILEIVAYGICALA